MNKHQKRRSTAANVAQQKKDKFNQESILVHKNKKKAFAVAERAAARGSFQVVSAMIDFCADTWGNFPRNLVTQGTEAGFFPTWGKNHPKKR